MRDTNYATEIRTGSLRFDDEEFRIERLFIKGLGRDEIRFSWWKGGKLMMRPMDATEEELLQLLREGIANSVFTQGFLEDLVLELQNALSREE